MDIVSYQYAKNVIYRVTAHAQTKCYWGRTSRRGDVEANDVFRDFGSVIFFVHDQSFRFLSPGSEERIIDHMWQILFIRSSRFIPSNNFYIYKTLFVLFSPCGSFKGILILAYLIICARGQTLQSSEPLFCSYCIEYHMVGAGHTGTKQMAFTHSHLLNKWNSLFVILLNFHLFLFLFCFFSNENIPFFKFKLSSPLDISLF